MALVMLILLGATAVWLRDPEAAAFAALVLIGIFLLALRRGLLGRILLALVMLDTAVWMVPAAVSNVRHGADLPYTAVPVLMSVTAIVGVLAAVGVARRWVAVVALGVALIVVGGSRIPSVGTPDPLGHDDLLLTAKNVVFSPTTLRPGSTAVAVRVINHDLFWHSFTIDALHVDVRVPMGATRRTIFTARPGTYEFYCRVPGHKQAGMKGTLTVTAS